MEVTLVQSSADTLQVLTYLNETSTDEDRDNVDRDFEHVRKGEMLNQRVL